MRDILLSVIVVALLLRAIKRPEYGAYTWAWLSMMNPHKLTFGFAFSLPWAQATAGITLLGALFSKSRKPLPLNGGVVTLIVLMLWMTVTSVFSVNRPELVWDRWFFVFKIYLMLLVTLMLIRGRQQTNVLVWVVVLSIAYFGIKGGVYTILRGGGGRVWGPPGGMLMDNNALAVGLVTVLPLMYYLRDVVANRWLKLGMLVSMLLMGVSILGSQSRGALLALLAMAFFLGVKSRYPVRFSVAIVLLVGVGISFMPETWTSRMDTIQSHTDDSSAMSRIYTWHTLWNVAMDRPLVGAGFRADNQALFLHYAPNGPQYDAFQGQFWVAHSIYFQALGEHGFVGLLLYLWLWVWGWVTASRVAKQAEKLPGLRDWVPMLVRMCQVSIIGFCVGGAFLSLLTLDLPYYILAFVTLARCAVQDQLNAVAMAPSRQTDPLPVAQGEWQQTPKV